MQTVTTIGLDIAKSVFQVHGIDAEGKVIIRRQLKRRYVLAFFQKLAPASLVLRPALHHIIGRASSRGSGTRCLMPPAYVKPYVKRKTMPLMPRPSAKQSPGQTCASSRPRRPSSRAA